MHLLVLGGGGFLGLHVVAQAQRAGHDVTVFSREGRAPLDGVEVLTGDRQGDLSALHGRAWDAVFDTFSDPDAVGATARLLSGAVGAYGYVSGMSVYHPDGPAVPSAGDPVRRLGDPTDRDDRSDAVGSADGGDPLQARSLDKLDGEEAIREGFDGAASFFRVGVMVGPRDPSDRFTWWPVRCARALAGTADRSLLVPGDLRRVVQYSDARDIAAFAVSALDRRLDGTFDTVGPGRAEPLSAVLDACLRAAGGTPGDLELVAADESWLRGELGEGGTHPLAEEERPLWFPEDQIPQDAIDASAAIAAGLTFRPAEDTARDVLEHVRQQGHDTLAAGFDAAVERDLRARARAVRPIP